MSLKLNKSNLNFKVYTAAEVPATGVENDIVIVSATPMKNWIMSPDAPSNTPRSEGDVWIQYSTNAADFNLTKQNAVMVRFVSAKQFVNDAWVGVVPKSYQNGAWVDWWNGDLYKFGEEIAWITGGWSIAKDCNGTVQKNADSITYDAQGVDSKASYFAIYTNEKISVTNATKITVNKEIITSGTGGGAGQLIFGIFNEIPTSNSDLKDTPVRHYKQNGFSAALTSEPTIDVSDLSGEYYVVIGFAFNGSLSYVETGTMNEVKVV